MKTASFAVAALAAVAATSSLAVNVNYNTTGSTLSCNGVVGCIQNTATKVTIGTMVFTYNTGSGSGVNTPSIINLGNIVTTGTGTNVSAAGLLLTINVNSTPPGASGTLPNGGVMGTISTNSSGAIISFSPNNTTTGFGSLPGVVISGAGQSFTYQVLNPTLGLQAPTVGTPIGQTSIPGAVTASASMTTNAGTTPQSTGTTTPFANPLGVTVVDGSNTPMSGVNVTFTAPAPGASGVFSNASNVITVPTNSSGIASAPITANGVAGSYSVTATTASAGSASFALTNSTLTANYNTTGSTLSCNGIAGCTQNTSTSLTVGGITLTYNSGSGSGVVVPSIVNLGNLVTTGTGTNVNVTGLLLTINVNSTPPGASGTLPNGAISGFLSTSQSSAHINFSPNNTTTTFGTLPGVTIGSGNNTRTYQVLNTSLGLQAPTIGNPIGETSIQGTMAMLGPTTVRPPCDLDVDGNGSIDALTDGLMILRAMLGLKGTAVTNGAIGGGSPTRTTWAQLQPYLNSNCGSTFAP